MATLFNLGSVGEGLPHAENTGLVISDTAKVQQISFLATLFDTFSHFFRTKIVSRAAQSQLSIWF